MNTDEFRKLTGSFIDAIENKINSIGGHIRNEQISNHSWLFYIDGGNHSDPIEVYELLNTGNEARWVFRGIQR